VDPDLGGRGGESPRVLVYLLVVVAGLALCLTLLFLGMRAVMDVGGACADGGPYVSAQPCPDGSPAAMLLGIFGLFLFGGLTALGGSRIGGPYGGLVFLAWPALFLSLGWNFLEYGFGSPGGWELGWVIPGVLFMLMGGGPLLTLLPSRGKPMRRDAAAMRRLLSDLQARQSQLAGTARRSDPFAPRGADGGGAPRMDLTSRLERLASLRAAGSLTDAEFEEAKRKVIAEVAAGR
jgi:hypothetical protein